MTTTANTTISVDDLRDRLARGDPVTMLDIRPEDDFEEWHIPGSTNLPIYHELKADDPTGLEAVEAPDGPVVTVCGAGLTAVQATQVLRDRGIEALTLEGGLQAWSLAWNTAEMQLDTGTTIVQVRRVGKGCLSYLVASKGKAAVVDPALDADVFISIAEAHGWTITHVLETHVHADHLSRARQLAEATDATHLLPQGAPVAFAHETIGDGEVLEVGKARIEVLGTPGHTPESVTFLLDDRALLTGDTLFPEGVGRPDLEAGDGAPDRARALHRSLDRLLSLPDEVVVLPAHASQPLAFDGQVHGARVGDLSNQLDLLSLDEDTFVEELLDRLPDEPPNHDRIVDHNRAGTFPDEDVIDLEAGANRCAAG